MRLLPALFAGVFTGLAVGGPPDQPTQPSQPARIVIQGSNHVQTFALEEPTPATQISVSNSKGGGIVVHEQEFSDGPLDGSAAWYSEQTSVVRFSTGATDEVDASLSPLAGFRSQGQRRYNPGLRYGRAFYNFRPGTRHRGAFPQMRNLNMRNPLGGGSSIQYGSMIDYGRSIDYRRGRRFQSDIRYGFSK